MWTCIVCKFGDIELDDVAIQGRAEHTALCICLRCYARETETAVRMDKRLRQSVIEALSQVEGG